jgi:hypothetical protein
MLHCAFCKKVLGHNRFQNGGHLSQCSQFKEVKAKSRLDIQYEEGFVNEDQYDSTLHEDLRFDFEDVLPELMFANDIFLKKQMLQCSVDLLKTFKAGYVKMIDGKYEKADESTYFEIASYIARTPMLSLEDATDLITLIKNVTHINGSRIALPRKYITNSDLVQTAIERSR